MRRSIFASSLVLAVLVLAPPGGARAQDASDSAAYRALTQTPLGALPLPFDVAVTGERVRALAVRTTYGIMSLDTHEYIHNFGIGIDIPAGTASLGLTAGYYWPDCKGTCRGHFMASAGVSENLVQLWLGDAGGGGTTFDIGIDAALGVGTPKDTTLASGNVAIPFSLVPHGRSLRLVPYVAPGLGVGLTRAEGSTEAGLLFTFGAGVGVIASRRFSAHVGLSRAFLPDGNWLVGVGLAFGGDR